ncbi:MAG: hypothetical protein ABJD07_08820 [Gemmatimonadaceae bacterium]
MRTLIRRETRIFSISHKAALEAPHAARLAAHFRRPGPPGRPLAHRRGPAEFGHANAHLVFTTYGRFLVDERDYVSSAKPAKKTRRLAGGT